MVVGDFDSLKASVRELFEGQVCLGRCALIQGVQFHHSDDLYSTDFDKAIDEIKRYESSHNVSVRFRCLRIDPPSFNGCGGRFRRTCGPGLFSRQSDVQDFAATNVPSLRDEYIISLARRQ
jgi:thiamine pyrophosphokinase